MKHSFLFMTCLLLSTTAFSQVGIGTTAPDASAALDIESTEKGLLLPRMTTTDRDLIPSPANSLLIFNTTTQCFEAYSATSSTWVAFSCLNPPGCTVNTAVVEVISGGGKTWMDRNLGASQLATSNTDYLAYGALFQWGRGSDGHECINWTSSTASDGEEQSNETATNSISDDPGNGNFILEPSFPYDWRSSSNDSLWQGVSGTNNPCPSGYRLPTDAELQAEVNSWGVVNNDYVTGAFDSPLKLPVAGYRISDDGSLSFVGERGGYWSSTVDGSNAKRLFFWHLGNNIVGSGRANGHSVRCIKD